jgi:hypothetical protein
MARERRKAGRVAAGWGVTVWDGAGHRMEGVAEDVSPRGMRVRLNGELRPHRFLLVSFTPPGHGRPLWVDSEIARREPGAVYGLRFLTLGPVVAERLFPALTRRS